MDLFQLAEQESLRRGRVVTPQVAALEAFDKPESEKRKRMNDVLEALQTGPKTTSQLIEAGGHRFATSIDALRQRGHEIVTTLAGHETHAIYKWICYRPRCKVEKSIQEAYYASEHWRLLSKARKEFDNWTCTQCKSRDDLETHHWTYTLFGESMERDLVTLCKACHGTIHQRTNIHFPRFVDEETARRLACLEQ